MPKTRSYCKMCHQPFIRCQSNLKYCSLECSIKANKEVTQVSWRERRAAKNENMRAHKTCEHCKQDFKPFNTDTQRFCCKDCSKAYSRLQWVNLTQRY